MDFSFIESSIRYLRLQVYHANMNTNSYQEPVFFISVRTKTFLTEVYDCQSDPGGGNLVPEQTTDTGAIDDGESMFIRSASINVVDRGKNLAMVTFPSTDQKQSHEDAAPAVDGNDTCELLPLSSEGGKIKLPNEVEETSKHRRVLR